jgi:thymidylate synthase (FAD)
MKVRLVSYSQPDPDYFGSAAVEDGKITSEDLIAYCARVSNPGNQDNHSSSSGLLSYLVKHKHWSPFEMVSACVEIETTRDIARQILRHRSFSFQEFSQRYADPVKELEFVTREVRLQDTKNRQNSIEIENDPNIQLNPIQQDLVANFRRKQHGLINQAKDVYQWAIENGIAKEQARAVLPEGNTVSRLYMNGTIRSWLHYIELRSGVETQKEHREVAIKCGEVLEKIFPSILKVAKGK